MTEQEYLFIVRQHRRQRALDKIQRFYPHCTGEEEEIKELFNFIEMDVVHISRSYENDTWLELSFPSWKGMVLAADISEKKINETWEKAKRKHFTKELENLSDETHVQKNKVNVIKTLNEIFHKINELLNILQEWNTVRIIQVINLYYSNLILSDNDNLSKKELLNKVLKNIDVNFHLTYLE